MQKISKIQANPFLLTVVAFALMLMVSLALPTAGFAQDTCGEGEHEVTVGVDVGCAGDRNPIYDYLSAVIKFLSAGVGLVVVLMIVVSGIQYITSAGNPQGIEAAKKRLTNAIIALLLYIFMAAILNFLIPGGIL